MAAALLSNLGLPCAIHFRARGLCAQKDLLPGSASRQARISSIRQPTARGPSCIGRGKRPAATHSHSALLRMPTTSSTAGMRNIRKSSSGAGREDASGSMLPSLQLLTTAFTASRALEEAGLALLYRKILRVIPR